MALNPSGLETEFRDTVFPTTSMSAATVAGLWRTALQNYASGIVPASTTVAAASATLEAALTVTFGTPGVGPTKAAEMETAMLAWATAIGLGMAGYTPTPPVGLIGFAAEFAKAPASWSATHAIAATLWSGLIDTWMETGIATLIAPPSTVVPWS